MSHLLSFGGGISGLRKQFDGYDASGWVQIRPCAERIHRVLLAEDALTRLGLKPGATAAEIRLAYRDLVKVWRPDRFGSDARLRDKAAEHLKEINEAYRVLEAADFRCGTQPGPAVTPGATQPSAHHTESSAHPSPERTLRIGLYAASAVLLACMGLFVTYQLRTSAHAPAPPAEAAAPVSSHKPEKPAYTRHPASSAQRTGTFDFQVWSLPQADSDRVQLACSAHPPGSEPYRNCIAAQLHALRPSAAPPEMAGMSTIEREAAETACSALKRGGAVAAYNRCLKQQVAALAAEPVRPDLSSFSQADRNAMQAACGTSRERGVADYDRCLTRFAQTLRSAEPQPQ